MTKTFKVQKTCILPPVTLVLSICGHVNRFQNLSHRQPSILTTFCFLSSASLTWLCPFQSSQSLVKKRFHSTPFSQFGTSFPPILKSSGNGRISWCCRNGEIIFFLYRMMLKTGTCTNEHLNIMSSNPAERFVLLWGGPLNQHSYKHTNVPNFSQLLNFPHLRDILCSLKILSDAFKSCGGNDVNDPNLFLHPSNENNPRSIHLASSGLMNAKIEKCMSTDSKLVHYAKWRLNCDTPSEQETLQASFFAIGTDLEMRFPFSLSGSRASKGHHLGTFMLSLHTPAKRLISLEGYLTNPVYCAQISTPKPKCEF